MVKNGGGFYGERSLKPCSRAASGAFGSDLKWSRYLLEKKPQTTVWTPLLGKEQCTLQSILLPAHHGSTENSDSDLKAGARVQMSPYPLESFRNQNSSMVCSRIHAGAIALPYRDLIRIGLFIYEAEFVLEANINLRHPDFARPRSPL